MRNVALQILKRAIGKLPCILSQEPPSALMQPDNYLLVYGRVNWGKNTIFNTVLLNLLKAGSMAVYIVT